MACDDGQGVDEEDLDDLNDADDGAAHPQAQLATDVGQKHLDLQGRPSQTIRRDPRQVGFMQRPQFPRESLASPGPKQVWGKMGAAFLSPLTLPDLTLGWPLVTLRAQVGPPQSDSAPQGQADAYTRRPGTGPRRKPLTLLAGLSTMDLWFRSL